MNPTIVRDKIPANSIIISRVNNKLLPALSPSACLQQFLQCPLLEGFVGAIHNVWLKVICSMVLDYVTDVLIDRVNVMTPFKSFKKSAGKKKKVQEWVICFQFGLNADCTHMFIFNLPNLFWVFCMKPCTVCTKAFLKVYVSIFSSHMTIPGLKIQLQGSPSHVPIQLTPNYLALFLMKYLTTYVYLQPDQCHIVPSICRTALFIILSCLCKSVLVISVKCKSKEHCSTQDDPHF